MVFVCTIKGQHKKTPLFWAQFLNILLANHCYTISAPAAEPEAMAEPQPDPEAKPIIGLLVNAVKGIFGK